MFKGFVERARQIARQFIPGFLREGLPAREIVNRLRDAGIDYGDSGMIGDIENIVAEQQRRETSLPLDRDSPIPDTFLTPREVRAQSQYTYTVRYEYYSDDVGGVVEGYFSISDNEQISIAELMRRAAPLVEEIERSLRVKMTNLELESASLNLPVRK